MGDSVTQLEFEKMLRRILAGEVEPEEWETWWKSRRGQLWKVMNRGDRERIIPSGWQADYDSMVKTQKGAAYYFYTKGRPETASPYYEERAQEETLRLRREALEAFSAKTAGERGRWEAYLEAHPPERVDFDWKRLLGIPADQAPPRTFAYQEAWTEEQWKECREELQLRLKENLRAKIAPLVKAYGMKKNGPKTFVRERNGLVSRIKFIGYFRGGGYEDMEYYLCPLYALGRGPLNLPAEVRDGLLSREMRRNWGVIQYGTEAVDLQKVSREFDAILTFLAEGVLPEWQKAGSLETYFSRERQDYLRAVETGPADPRTGRPMWGQTSGGERDPWRENDYLFGVWDLLSGREEPAYARLAACAEHNRERVEAYLREYPKEGEHFHNPFVMLYRNAERFLGTVRVPAGEARRRAVRETYEEVCGEMRVYHGLSRGRKTP